MRPVSPRVWTKRPRMTPVPDRREKQLVESGESCVKLSAKATTNYGKALRASQTYREDAMKAVLRVEYPL